MTTKIITVEATPPTESTGADYYKGAPLNAAEFDQNLVNLRAAVDRKASLSNPTFTGTVVLPATTSIGDVSATELQYLNSVTSNVQDQINSKAPINNPTFTGTVSLPGGTANGVLYLNGSKQVTSGSGLVFDGSNLGIGVTPSAWYNDAGGRLQINKVGIGNVVGFDIAAYSNNAYRDSGGWKYIGSATAMLYQQYAGKHIWSTAPSGTAGNAITFTQAMTLDSSGNLGIGTASPTNTLSVSGNANITGNTTLGDSSTDTVTVNGYMGIGGTTPDSHYKASVYLTNLIDPVSGFASFLSYLNPVYTGAESVAEYLTGIDSEVYSTINTGHTNSGYNRALSGITLRNAYGASADDNGTLSTLYGLAVTYGHHNVNTSATPQTTTATGLQVTPYRRSGTITSMYDIYLAADSTGGTVTNRWGIYQANTANNYFAGNIGLGVTPSAWGTGTYKALEITSGAYFYGSTSQPAISANAYHDGTNWIYKETGLASRYDQIAGVHRWFTAPSGTAGSAISFTQAMTLDASGNLLVGGTSVYAATMTAYGSASRSGGLGIRNSAGTAVGGIYTYAAGSGGGSTDIMVEGVNSLRFYTNSAERARIDSSGNLLVGTTSPTLAGIDMKTVVSGGVHGIGVSCQASGTPQAMRFAYGTTAVGSIVIGPSSTSYNTSSDYRLKEDYKPVEDAIARLNQLKPINFAWKVDGSRCDGFLAHELKEVIPEAATGTKDEMRIEEYEVTHAIRDEEGNVITEAVMGEREVPIYQGIDQSKIVPLLTAALQEAVAKIESQAQTIESLTQRIEALEYKGE